MIAECARLLLQLTECAFDPELVAVKPDNGQRIQCQTGACQDTLDAVHFHQHKPQLLVELLSPQQVNAVITDGFRFAIKLYPRFPELPIMGDEQLFDMDSGPLFRRTSPPGLAGTRLLVWKAVQDFFAFVMISMRTSPLALRDFNFSRAGTVRKYLSSRSRESPKGRAA